MRSLPKSILAATLTAAFAIQAFAQAPTTEPIPVGDTIGERAAWTLEQQRAKNNPQPVAPAPAVAAAAPQPQSQQHRAGIAPDSAVTGIRGFADALEASFLINGKRAVGSLKYPTLVDGWKLVDISASGAIIEQSGKSKERKQLTFSGVVPFQQNASNSAGNSAGAAMPLPFAFPTPSPVYSSPSPLPRSSPLPLPSQPRAVQQPALPMAQPAVPGVAVPVR